MKNEIIQPEKTIIISYKKNVPIKYKYTQVEYTICFQYGLVITKYTTDNQAHYFMSMAAIFAFSVVIPSTVFGLCIQEAIQIAGQHQQAIIGAHPAGIFRKLISAMVKIYSVL
ncbi:hypothetical protein SB6419_05444 [Klebsiella spallanzanii]|nr:hypothetical protein SB6419_05444 [Klebsiella spallanzanii]